MITQTTSIDGTPLLDISKCSEKKVIAECDICGKPQILIWANYQRSQELRGHDKKTFCRSCKSKENLKKARENGPWNKGQYLPADKRQGKPYITKDGYRAIFQYRFDRKYHSQWANYRKEHLVVMEKHLDRPLNSDDVIHHLDGDKLNNLLENLWLTDSSGHRNAHNSLQKIGFTLMKSGFIVFDDESGEYKISDKLTKLCAI